MKALITGAAGFIGSRLALALRSEGTSVRALVRPHHDVRELEAAGVEIARGDAAEVDHMSAAAEGCGVIFHLAAARGAQKLDHRSYQEQNKRLTEAVAKAALAGCGPRIIFASTATLTGYGGREPQTEETAARPNSAYRSSRELAERVLDELQERHGLDVVIARIPQRVMGPGAREWGKLARKVRDGDFRVFPRGGSMHSGDVDDIVQGLRLCASAHGVSGERFLLAAAFPIPTVEALRTIAEELDVPFAPRMIVPAPFRAYAALGNATYRWTRLALPHHFTVELYSARVVLDIGKARRALGYSPRFEPRQSLRRTVAWLRAESLV
jgi:nucleoside-diphosphate-sugar epimerase